MSLGWGVSTHKTNAEHLNVEPSVRTSPNQHKLLRTVKKSLKL
jgi:hypothetical protein